MVALVDVEGLGYVESAGLRAAVQEARQRGRKSVACVPPRESNPRIFPDPGRSTVRALFVVGDYAQTATGLPEGLDFCGMSPPSAGNYHDQMHEVLGAQPFRSRLTHDRVQLVLKLAAVHSTTFNAGPRPHASRSAT